MAELVEEKRRVEFTLDSCPHAPLEIFSKEIDPGVWILLDPEMPNWIAVDSLGKEIVELCNGERSLEKVAEILCAKYNGDLDSSEVNILEFANILSEKRFLASTPFSYSCVNKSKVQNINVLWINVTNQCNLRCLHCFRTAGEARKDELSVEEICDIIDQFEKIAVGSRSLILSGGEPFLKKDIIEVLRRAKEKNLAISLLTNGTLINRAIARSLRELGPFTIQVSLDGGTQEANDRIRGKGSYKNAVRGIQFLRGEGIKKGLVLSMTIMKLNRHEIRPFVQLAEALGVDAVHFPIFQPVGRGSKNRENLELTPEELAQAIDHLFSIQSKCSIKMDFSLTPEFLKPIRGAKRDYCGAGVALWSIEPDGRVTPCPGLSDAKFTAGNIRKRDLKSITQHSSTTKQFRSLQVKENPKCAACELRFICGGGCHVVNYVTCGTLTGMGSFTDCDRERIWFWKALKTLVRKEVEQWRSNQSSLLQQRR